MTTPFERNLARSGPLYPDRYAIPERDQPFKDPVVEFQQWLKTARPGWRHPYYVGFLAADREYLVPLDESSNPRYGHIFTEPADTLGRLAMGAYMTGKVFLTQEKLGPGRYIYWATRRKH